jgi:transketolase
VGLAIAQAHLAALYNRPNFDIFNNYTFVIMGDGCHQEGVTSEAASLAGHLKLNHLIVLYDDNKITIDGETHLSFTEDVPARFRSYGWNTLTVEDGNNDLAGILSAIEQAKHSDKPTLISVKTFIGFGSLKQNTESVHGAPLKADDLKQVKSKFGFDPEKTFEVPEDVYAHFHEASARAAHAESEWSALFTAYAAAFPAEAAEIQRRFAGQLPENWSAVLPRYKPEDKALATRQLSEIVLNAVAPVVPEFVGGSADLTPSTLTWLKCSHDFQADKHNGRYFHFGVREHGMAAVCNGLTAYGGESNDMVCVCVHL